MIKTAAMHGPQLATDPLLFQLIIDRRRQAAIQKNEIER